MFIWFVSKASEDLRRSLMGQVVSLVEQRELERRRGSRPKENPVVEQFLLTLPPDLPEIDLNVMKLAALFTARNGVSFQQGLLQRESRNTMVMKRLYFKKIRFFVCHVSKIEFLPH